MNIILPMKKTTLFCFVFLVVFAVGCGVPNLYEFEKEFCKEGSAPGELSNPIDLELTPDGNLVVTDSGNNRFQVLDGDGKLIFVGGEFGNGKLQIKSVSGCAVHRISGDILVCDLKGNKVVRYKKDGKPEIRVIQSVRAPLDAAFDKLGNIYVLMARQADLYKYDQIGNLIGKVGGAGQSALVFPVSMRIRDDIIYIADSGSRRIVKMKLNGDFIAQFNTKGEYEPMKGPSSVFVDETGNLFTLDVGDIPVAFLNPDGKLFSKVGGFGDEPGSFMYPRSIVANSNGDVYILDSNRNVIIKYKKNK